MKAKSFVCDIKYRGRVRRITVPFEFCFLFLRLAKSCLDSLDCCDRVGDFTRKFPREISVGFEHSWISFSFGGSVSK